uniref:Uncharacterized protein n=1 Tax=Anguilla anguilla TaxID=7936 RepID=A0A0E9VEB3_ANGAN
MSKFCHRVTTVPPASAHVPIIIFYRPHCTNTGC